MAEAGVDMMLDGRTVLEAGAPVVWFTFPGARHDIGRFHTADCAFTGFYANILTPVERRTRSDGIEDWHTTDLFLDLFLPPRGAPSLLDVEELDEAVARGWVEDHVARQAHAEAARLLHDAQTGAWPPPVVDDWPVERARAVARSSAR
jgi:predicted RNA-binding protein associated with RNAse of E/G family